MGGALAEAAAYSGGSTFASATQLTLYTVDGLTEALEWANDGVAADEAACLWLAYLRWYRGQGETPPPSAPAPPARWIDRQAVLHSRRDADEATLLSLATGEMGSRQRPLSTNDDGDGALQRSAPFGLIANIPPAMLERLVLDASAITHGSTRAQHPAAVLAGLVQELTQRGEQLRGAVQAAAAHADALGASELSLALGALADDPTADVPDGLPTAARTLCAAVQLSLRTSNDDAGAHFSTLLQSCTEGGPATRATAAVAGSIVGALHGSSALPQHSVGSLEGAVVVREVADRFAAVMGA